MRFSSSSQLDPQYMYIETEKRNGRDHTLLSRLMVRQLSVRCHPVGKSSVLSSSKVFKGHNYSSFVIHARLQTLKGPTIASLLVLTVLPPLSVLITAQCSGLTKPTTFSVLRNSIMYNSLATQLVMSSPPNSDAVPPIPLHHPPKSILLKPTRQIYRDY